MVGKDKHGMELDIVIKNGRDEKDVEIIIEEAVRKMASLPAQKYGLKDRGLIREGTWADIVIFDPKTEPLTKSRWTRLMELSTL